MDFVTSHFGKMKLWPDEHKLNTFSTCLSSKLDSSLIKTLERIRFSSNQNIGEGESNFDDWKCPTQQSFIPQEINSKKIKVGN